MSRLTFDIDYEHENRTITFGVEVIVKAYSETYGEDVDGNRGETRTFVDTVTIEHVFDEDGIEVNPEDFEDLADAISEKAEEVYDEG